jgi:lipopolysaccharide transport system ATP-binding protein
MSRNVIEVENISKQYRLGKVGSGTLKDDLKVFWSSLTGRANPFLSVGEENIRNQVGTSDYVWALRDIAFSVKQGEVLGIIGKNGAGKSTLLKILSRVTAPTTGLIKVKGRIASLLEVGTGFHPDLTGRENVFLNGAILGMTAHEVKSKFDEIVAFSGVEKYIDTPVKRYSSGMYVRLAFAVAAHLEPEILIIDEVLAVGDAEFQKKCLGKMQDVSVKDGRTVLFVSHNLAAVKELCTRALIMKNGQIHFQGVTTEAILDYSSNMNRITGTDSFLNDYSSRRGNGEVRFFEVSINNDMPHYDPSEETRIRISLEVIKPVSQIHFLLIAKGIYSEESIANSSYMSVSESKLEPGARLSFDLVIEPNTFRTGYFPLYLWIGRKTGIFSQFYEYDIVDGIYNFNFQSSKPPELLGYNSEFPAGYTNLNTKISNLSIL